VTEIRPSGRKVAKPREVLRALKTGDKL
jgi:hypothetical protein